MDLWKLGLLSVGMHILFLYAIFDVFYVSPIITGLPAYLPSSIPSTKRLVLFVSDGLRAHSFYNHIHKTKHSFLRSIMECCGNWGVAHTHVPTESRPGHVAMIAGVFEDVSAVTKGWKENPVAFDSVFNRSKYTWSWGSPDILPMFAKGAAGNHVYTWTYPGESEDFASGDASKLDSWVFDRFQEFIENAKSDDSVNSKVEERGTVFFLHLLGVDTNGHGHKPHSLEYIRNIELVDNGIERTTQIINEFYGDNDTVFLFTSDHGMTDWGSHGAGSEHETVVPFIVWGNGVKKAFHSFSQNLSWHQYLQMGNNLQQVDIAPLMACLTGLPIPTNSMGLLPSSILDLSHRNFFSCAYSNFQQMKAQMEYLQEEKRKHTFRILFKHFDKVSPKKLESVENEINKLMQQRRFAIAARLCLDWVPILKEGFVYYHRYEIVFQTACVTMCFIAWIIFVSSILLTLPKLKTSRLNVFIPSEMALCACGGVSLFLWLQSLPYSNYIYCWVPILLINLTLRLLKTYSSKVEVVKLLVLCGLSFLFVVPIVLEFFHRTSITLTLFFMSTWSFLDPQFIKLPVKDKCKWSALCLMNAVYPCLPTVGQNVSFIHNSYAPALLFIYLILNAGKNYKLKCYAVAVLLCILNSVYVNYSLESKSGLPLLCQSISVCVLFISPIIPLYTHKNLYSRLNALVLCLLLPLILMSLTYETCFYISFALLLYHWIELESFISNCDWQKMEYNPDISYDLPFIPIDLTDLRRAYFSLYFVFLAFFGTGNLASFNSFNPSFLHCFTTVFEPFIMATLLVFKMLLPMIIPCYAMCALEMITGRPANQYLFIKMIFADSMSLIFFFLLKDTGSWLDIGTSISHFVICIISTVFILIMHAIAKFMLTFKLTIDFEFIVKTLRNVISRFADGNK